MARAIYGVKLIEHYIPALNEQEALEMNESLNNDSSNDSNIRVIVQEEDTMRLFILAKSLYDLDKFEINEIVKVVQCIAESLGYKETCNEIAGCVVHWIENLENMTMQELQEWIIG